MNSKAIAIHLNTGAVLHLKLSKNVAPLVALETCRSAMSRVTGAPVAIMADGDGDGGICIDWSRVIAVQAVDYLN